MTIGTARELEIPLAGRKAFQEWSFRVKFFVPLDFENGTCADERMAPGVAIQSVYAYLGTLGVSHVHKAARAG